MGTKITYFITSLNFGGAEIGMVRLINGIVKSDQSEEFDITVVSLLKTPRDVISLLPNSVKIHNLDVENIYEVWKIRPLWKELRDTDILVCSLYHASVLGVFIGTVKRVPQILTWQHNSEYRSMTAQILYRICYSISDNVLADSEAVRNVLISDFNISRSKVSVLPIAGVDTEKFSPNRRSIGFNNDKSLQIGTIGRLVRQKGYDYLIDTASKMNEAHFHIIGNGELREELIKECDYRNVTNVTFHGQIKPDLLPNYISSFDVYFQPSRYEGLCMTVIEAMAVGIPVVASKTGGIQESVEQGKSGILVEPGNVDGYIEALSFFELNPGERNEFGKNARKRVKNKYSRSVFVDLFCELIR